jgi:Leucine-rich repeat (LRR) protein
LGLNRNELTTVPAELGNLTALLWLDLRYNKMTTVPAALGNLKAMYSLDLRGNPDLAALPEEVEQLGKTHGGICNIRV